MASSGPAQKAKMLDLSAYRPALVRYFRKRARPADIDDLVQDVFLNVHARQSEAPIENMEGYLFAVARGALVRKGERDSRQPWQMLDDDPELAIDPELVSPERVFIGRESLSRAVLVIEELPERTRQIFVLHRFEEMTYPAIAASLGISVSAVEKHIMIALRSLVAALGAKR